MGVAAESYERSATKDMLQKAHVPGILKYWVCVQRGQSILMRRCLFSLGWPPF